MTRSQLPFQGPINIKYHRSKSGRHGDLAPGICVPLVTILLYPPTCFGLSGHPQGDKLYLLMGDTQLYMYMEVQMKLANSLKSF